MINNRTNTICLIFAISLTGCSWIGIDNYDRREKYLEATSEPVTEIPPGLDQPNFEPALHIPNVVDSREIAGEVMDIGLPPTLSTTFGVEQIVLKKLGKDRWIFLDSPPARVWPKITRFWEENNLLIQRADPRRGILESRWIVSREGNVDDVYASVTSGTSWTDSLATVQNKFLLSIEPGVRSGSSEVYLKHKQVPLNAPVRDDVTVWKGDSDNADLENEILTKLAYYLGENINQQVVSLGPTSIRMEKARLVPDSVKPELRYRLSFDRAWATVESALKNAQIQVEDLNRSDAVFFVVFNELTHKKPGFIRSLFGGKKAAELNESNRVQLHLVLADDEVVVTIMANETQPADATKAERLLKIIKESST